jgi:hypothetical protein
MTEDDERVALRAIEYNLVHSDPAFAARMRSPETADRPFPFLSALCVVAFICVPIEALLFGRLSGVVTLDLVAVAAAIVLFRRRGGRVGGT